MLDSRYNIMPQKKPMPAQAMSQKPVAAGSRPVAADVAAPQRVGMSKPAAMEAKPMSADVAKPQMPMQKKPMPALTPERKKMAMQDMVSKFGRA